MRAMPIAVAILTLMTAPGALADPVAVNPEGDADAELVAVSGTGNASASFLAVSGTGNASRGLVAASGTGDASSKDLYTGGGCMESCFYYGSASVSGTGNATAEGPLAVSGAGNATGGGMCVAAATCPGVAASALGDATCRAEFCVALSGDGDAHGDAAGVSVTGRASCSLSSSWLPSWLPDCAAISVCDELAARGRPEACT